MGLNRLQLWVRCNVLSRLEFQLPNYVLFLGIKGLDVLKEGDYLKNG